MYTHNVIGVGWVMGVGSPHPTPMMGMGVGWGKLKIVLTGGIVPLQLAFQMELK